MLRHLKGKRRNRCAPKNVTSVEKHEVVTNCDHLSQLKFSKALPFAFTEHGAIQAANVLNSSEAAEVGVYVVRAFVRLREMVMTDKMLALRLDDLEHRVELLGLKHGDLEHNTTVQIKEIVDALRQLMATPAQTRKRPIGFVIPGDA